GLAEDVRYYGQWMRDEAFKRIGHLYPKVNLPQEYGAQKNKQNIDLSAGDQFRLEELKKSNYAGEIFFINTENQLAKYSQIGGIEIISTPSLRAAGPIKNYLDLVNTFEAKRFVFLEDTVMLNIQAPDFAMNDESYFVLRYDLLGDAEPVDKKLPFSGANLQLIQEEIFLVEDDAVDPERASNFRLYYYEVGPQKATLVGEFEFQKLNHQDLEKEVTYLLMALSPKVEMKQRQQLVAAYIEEAYGHPLGADFINWFQRIDRKVQKERE
ncbi:MAG: hypothetical protein AAFU60_14485, partial [Bacteroidota bacterium]